MTTAPMPAKQILLHCNPFTGKDGDRVRVTFEATIGHEIDQASDSLLTKLSDKFAGMIIELLERPFAVKETVRIEDATLGKIIAFTSDGRAVVEYEAGDTTNVVARDTSCLTRA